MDDIEQFRHIGDVDVGNKPVGTYKPSRKTKSGSAFVRGPIPLDWLIRATSIPRRNALVVGLVLFYLAGLNKDRNGLVLSVRRCKPFGLERKSVQRGLADLEKLGLIRVSRLAGQCPRVDILSA
jgi:hypothetical protein